MPSILSNRRCDRPDCESWVRYKVVDRRGAIKGGVCGKHLTGLISELSDSVLIVGKVDAES